MQKTEELNKLAEIDRIVSKISVWFRFAEMKTKIFDFGFNLENKSPNRIETNRYVLNITMYKIFQDVYR